jgi:hypothetical protein
MANNQANRAANQGQANRAANQDLQLAQQQHEDWEARMLEIREREFAEVRVLQGMCNERILSSNLDRACGWCPACKRGNRCAYQVRGSYYRRMNEQRNGQNANANGN